MQNDVKSVKSWRRKRGLKGELKSVLKDIFVDGDGGERQRVRTAEG